MKLFKPYTTLEEYYNIDMRINRPSYIKVARVLANAIVNIASKDISKELKKVCAIDAHVHTIYSWCSYDTVEKTLLEAYKKGLSGICIMDHHTIDGYYKALEVKEELVAKGIISEDFIIIPGIEYTTTVGHVGAMFVDKDIYIESCSPSEIINKIHNMGGLAICVHPYEKGTGIKDLCKELPFDAVEYASGSILSKKETKLNLIETRDLPYAKLGASDAHLSSFIGCCYTIFPQGTKTLEDVKQAILNKQTQGIESVNIHRFRKFFK